MKIRTANYDDLEEIKALCARNGLNIKKINQKIWRELPAIKEFKNIPIGWVLESDNKKIVGVLLNFFMNYKLNEKNYKAAIGSSWAVDGEYRKGGFALFDRWINQKKIDLIIDGTATERLAKILTAFKFKNVPTKDYDKVMYWILDYPQFIKTVLKKKIKIFIGPLNFVAGLVLKFYDLIIGRNKIFDSKKNVIEVKYFNHKFDDFWNKLPKKNKFIAERTSAMLKWHFESAMNKQKISVLALYYENNLNGYIIIMRADNNDIGLKRMQIIDIQTLSNNEETATALITNAIIYAQKQGVYVLELIGFGQDIRRQAAKMNPYVRKLSYSPFFYKLINKELKNTFSEKVEWNASLYEGDGSLDLIA